MLSNILGVWINGRLEGALLFLHLFDGLHQRLLSPSGLFLTDSHPVLQITVVLKVVYEVTLRIDGWLERGLIFIDQLFLFAYLLLYDLMKAFIDSPLVHIFGFVCYFGCIPEVFQFIFCLYLFGQLFFLLTYSFAVVDEPVLHFVSCLSAFFDLLYHLAKYQIDSKYMRGLLLGIILFSSILRQTLQQSVQLLFTQLFLIHAILPLPNWHFPFLPIFHRVLSPLHLGVDLLLVTFRGDVGQTPHLNSNYNNEFLCSTPKERGINNAISVLWGKDRGRIILVVV